MGCGVESVHASKCGNMTMLTFVMSPRSRRACPGCFGFLLVRGCRVVALAGPTPALASRLDSIRYSIDRMLCVCVCTYTCVHSRVCACTHTRAHSLSLSRTTVQKYPHTHAPRMHTRITHAHTLHTHPTQKHTVTFYRCVNMGQSVLHLSCVACARARTRNVHYNMCMYMSCIL